MRFPWISWLVTILICSASLANANDFLSDGFCNNGQCLPQVDAGNLLCDICDPGCNRTWLDVNFLLWNYDGFRVPNLVASSAAGTPRALVGRLDDPGTTAIFGSDRIGDSWQPGLNLNFGRYLGDCGNWAIAGSVWALDNGESSQTFPSNGSDEIISRPFFNLAPNVNAWDSELVNYPGIVEGSMTIATESKIYSGGIGFQKKMCCCSDPCTGRGQRVDFYVGYRDLLLEESLVISETLYPSGAFIAPGTTIDLFDRFDTQNRFQGVELGLSRLMQRNRWTLMAQGKVGLGNVHQTALIDGRTTVTVPGVAPSVLPHGLLATESNIGEYERDVFGVLTQAQLELGYFVTCRLRMKLGYNLVYLNDVARPGDQIDPYVNATQIDPNVAVTGVSRPHFKWKSDALFLHGLNLGFEYRF